MLDSLRPYLLGASGVLLVFGLWQLYRSRGTCQRRSRAGVAIFWISALIVVSVAVVPQTVAALFAGGLPGGVATYATDLNLDQLRADFNRASGETRLIVLLSPT